MAEECRPDPTEQHLGLEDEQEPERVHYNGDPTRGISSETAVRRMRPTSGYASDDEIDFVKELTRLSARIDRQLSRLSGRVIADVESSTRRHVASPSESTTDMQRGHNVTMRAKRASTPPFKDVSYQLIAEPLAVAGAVDITDRESRGRRLYNDLGVCVASDRHVDDHALTAARRDELLSAHFAPGEILLDSQAAERDRSWSVDSLQANKLNLRKEREVHAERCLTVPYFS